MPPGQKFFYDSDSDVFYIVNYQEETYFGIGRESPYHELFMHLYCNRWEYVEDKVKQYFKKVDRIQQLDGSQPA